MTKIAYEAWNPQDYTVQILIKANRVIDHWAAQGYDLTLRQVYYQFVAQDLFPDDRKWRLTERSRWVRDENGTTNAEPNYKWLGEILNRGRLAGYIDWDAMVDRTRALQLLPQWDDEIEIIGTLAAGSGYFGFRTDRWERQDHRLEVWIEKEALAGVFERICDELHVPFFCCRGYPSQSSVWRAANRLKWHIHNGQEIVILHFGDHDPSGMNMTEDIQTRLRLFGVKMDLFRLALNMDQVEEYDPPPNPTKMSDSRAEAYILDYGYDSWELDALEPNVLSDLVRGKVEEFRDQDLWDEATDEDEESQRILGLIAKNFDGVKEYVEGLDVEEEDE